MRESCDSAIAADDLPDAERTALIDSNPDTQVGVCVCVCAILSSNKAAS